MLRCQGRISVGLYVTYTVLNKQLFYSNISAMYNIFSECLYDDVMVTILPYQIELSTQKCFCEKFRTVKFDFPFLQINFSTLYFFSKTTTFELVQQEYFSIIIILIFKKLFNPLVMFTLQSNLARPSLRTADAFPVVASLPPKNSGGREATTGNASAVRRLDPASHDLL